MLGSPRKSRVSYFYKEGVGQYHFGPMHPMKPHRLTLTHHLLTSYELYRKMDVLEQHIATPEEIEAFHTPDYVEFLKKVAPTNVNTYKRACNKYQMGPDSDCPVFEGMFDFMSQCAGGSIDAAMRANHDMADVCVNWSGGLHHAKKSEAAGFCYVNDIVLSIIELLKYHQRVLYLDIDIHHGDGVEEAFYCTGKREGGECVFMPC